MSLDHNRIVAGALAKLASAGFDKNAAPKTASGKSGLEEVVDALADATVTEIETYGPGGTSGTDLGMVHTQSAPATQWGPIAHTFGRRANVYVMDSTGRQTFGEVVEAVIGSVIIKFANPKSGSARLS